MVDSINTGSNPKIAQLALETTKEKEAVFQCPGHNEFFHHYNNYDKAKRKAQSAVDKLLKNTSENKVACYKLIQKNEAGGKDSGYFNRLNSIYKYAVVLVYQHQDNCEHCSYYKEFKDRVSKTS